MSITFSWYVENQIAVATLDGRVTIDDLTVGNNIVTTWMDASEAPKVHLIFDATRMQGIAFSGPKTLTILKYLNHPQIGEVLAHGIPAKYKRIVNLLGTSITRLTRAHFSSFDSFEECVNYLYSLDPNLPDRNNL